MFDDNDSDEEPSLDELFETGDSDSLEEHDATNGETADDSNSSQPDWAETLFDDDDDNSPSETSPNAPATTSDSASNSTDDNATRTTADPPVTSASGASTDTSEDPSLILSKSSLSLLPFSSDTNTNRNYEWLDIFVKYTKIAVQKIFYVIMAPVVFILAFLGWFAGYFLPWIGALATILAFGKLWSQNPIVTTGEGRLLGTLILGAVFLGFVNLGFRTQDYYDDINPDL